jgi:GDPmannose 4,6-dehydratase
MNAWMGDRKPLRLGNLDALRDWGHAKDYVEAMYLLVQKDVSDDYVISSGEQHSVRDFCEVAFSEIGLDYRNHVITEERYLRPTEVDALIANTQKVENKLNWVASTKWDQLAKLMTKHDFEALLKVNSN